MRTTFISDTHRKEDEIILPGGDLLVFSGDCMTSGYNVSDMYSFLEWMKLQDYRHKVCIAGNHDRYFEKVGKHEISEIFAKNGITYLCDSMTDIEGIKIYGTPWQPAFCNWAFNVINGETLSSIYDMIPGGMDILVTHCPPYGILDRSHRPRPFYGMTGEENLGSVELLDRINSMGDMKPRYHIFGHIHGDGGKYETIDDTVYINASICDESYYPVNKIVTLDV